MNNTFTSLDSEPNQKPGIYIEGVWQPPPDPFDGLEPTDLYAEVANQLEKGTTITLEKRALDFLIDCVRVSVQGNLTFGDAGEHILPALEEAPVREVQVDERKLCCIEISQQVRNYLLNELLQVVKFDGKEELLENPQGQHSLIVANHKPVLSDVELMSLVSLQMERGETVVLLPNEFHHFSLLIAESYNARKMEKSLQVFVLRCQFAQPKSITPDQLKQLALDYAQACNVGDPDELTQRCSEVDGNSLDEQVAYELEIPKSVASDFHSATESAQEFENQAKMGAQDNSDALRQKIDDALIQATETGGRAYLDLSLHEAALIAAADVHVAAQMQVDETELMENIFKELQSGTSLHLTGPEFAVLESLFTQSRDYPEQNSTIYARLLDFFAKNTDANTYKSMLVHIRLPNELATSLQSELQSFFE